MGSSHDINSHGVLLLRESRYHWDWAEIKFLSQYVYEGQWVHMDFDCYLTGRT